MIAGGDPDTGPGLRDWSARARSTVFDAQRYTRFVVLMKKALSLAAFAVIAAVVGFFFVERQPRNLAMSYARMGMVQDDLAMIKPRLTGADAKGNPFVVTAAAAIQDPHDSKRARLKTIEADLALDKNSWINVRAVAGAIDMTRHTLDLNGGIDMFTDTGYQLHTQSALVDLKQNVVTGTQEVTGQGPMGTVRADRFHADRTSNQILLQGNVRMTIDKGRT